MFREKVNWIEMRELEAGRLNGVSVSVPTLVDIRGRKVRTSILKNPTGDRVYISIVGPENNATAVHSEHVLITPVETLEYWHEKLGLAGEPWGAGFWGENLTISGLPDETEMRIGSVLKLGETVKLEVVGPRVPCYKLMWRIGMPNEFITEMMLDGRVGYYARVLRTGYVSAGNEVSVLAIPDHGMTTARLARQLAPGANGDVEDLQFALGLPSIGKQAASGIGRKLTKILDDQRCEPHRWSGWRPFRLLRREIVAPSVVSVTFEAVDGAEIAASRAGQHISVKLPSGTIRNWSLSHYDEYPQQYRITVKRLRDGRGSGELHSLSTGDIVKLRAPSGSFYLNPAGVTRNVLISAGIGITPMISMLKMHVARKKGPPVLWVHVARNGESYIHRGEVDELMRRGGDTVSSLVAFSTPSPNDVLGRDYDHAGRLTPAEIASLTEPYILQRYDKAVSISGTESLYYLCGPVDFEDMVRRTLINAGVPSGYIHSELFGSSAGISSSAAPEVAKVQFTKAGISASWFRDDPVSLLELAEKAGLTPDFDCRSGECHRCAVKLIGGKVAYPLPPQVPAVEGEVLLCCARPSSEKVSIII